MTPTRHMTIRERIFKNPLAAPIALALLVGLEVLHALIDVDSIDSILETPATERGPMMSAIIEGLNWALTKLVAGLLSPYFIGFFAAVVLLLIWHSPTVVKWLANRRKSRRDVTADNQLADQCEALAEELLTESAALQRMQRTRIHSTQMTDDIKEQQRLWAEDRLAEVKEVERINVRLSAKLSRIVAHLEGRGTSLDKWELRVDAYNIEEVAYGFNQVAYALRAGDYAGRTFKFHR